MTPNTLCQGCVSYRRGTGGDECRTCDQHTYSNFVEEDDPAAPVHYTVPRGATTEQRTKAQDDAWGRRWQRGGA